MTAESEKKILEMIEQAEVVADPLENLVEKAKTDPSAPFEPEVLASLADLEEKQPAQFYKLRAELKAAGVLVSSLDKKIAKLNGGGAGREPSHTDVLIGLTSETKLFHTADETAYAEICIKGHRETFKVRGKQFRRWLTNRFFEETSRAPNSEALQSALNQIEAEAHYKGTQREVYHRVAEYEGRIYLDLADEPRRVVEIGPEGWKVTDNPPVSFHRTPGMQPLPVPEKNGSVEALKKFVNLASEADFVLLLTFLMAALRARGPYPVLGLYGDGGSGKSSASRIARLLLDPSEAPLRALPRDTHGLFIAANNAHVMAFDNVSELPGWMSNVLCQLSTGGGYAVRQLYTDQDEVVFSVDRPIVLNGIEEFVTEPDLSDRTFFLYLKRITEEQRRPEQELRAEFEKERPRLLGALVDLAAHGLRNLPATSQQGLPRMADAFWWARAWETALWPAGTVETAYRSNREQAIETVLEADPVATALLAMMTGGIVRTVRTVRPRISKDLRRATYCREWKGTASDLLGDVGSVVDESLVRSRAWPKTPRDLGGRLRRIRSLLSTKGMEIDFHGPEGHANAKMIYITAKVEVLRKTPVAPVAPLAKGVSVETPKPTDGADDGVAEEDEVLANEYSPDPLD